MATAKFFIDPTLAGAAGPYYNLYPVEPTPSGTTADWLRVDGKPTLLKTQNLDEWLAAIAGAASAGGNVVLVCHGNKLGLKLYIGDPKQDVHLELQALDAIRHNLDGSETDAETAKILLMKPDAYGKLKALVTRVQGLGLSRVDVRACNTGQDPVPMSALQQFFNCDTFCCPKMLDSFGPIGLGKFATDPATFDKWVKDHPGAEVAGTAPNRFAFYQNLAKGVNSEAIAESAKGAKAWADSKMPAGGNYTGNNQLYYHALTNLKNKMIFAGEPAFRAELAEATKGNVPSRKIDVNAPLTLP
jgi:hypothetical protein